MPYVENIKVGSGETWPIRDAEVHEGLKTLQNNFEALRTDVAGKAASTHTHKPSEAGAAPSGYGLGAEARFIENDQLLSSATETGFYRWAGGNADPDNPFGLNMPGSMMVIKRSSTYVTQIATKDDTTGGLLKVRKMVEGAWGQWLELYTYSSVMRLNPAVHYGPSLPAAGNEGRVFLLI